MHPTSRVEPLFVGGPWHNQVRSVDTTAQLPDHAVPVNEPPVTASPGPGEAWIDRTMYRHGELQHVQYAAAGGSVLVLRCRIAYAQDASWSEPELLNAWFSAVLLIMTCRGWLGMDEGQRWFVGLQTQRGDG